mmetsp:Transcript_7308/g.17712  ORF Transcript_7308/g.17712 Transcript_7308/m.17712 type:complete len:239 (+) Transcript_7308:1578-2294(+)
MDLHDGDEGRVQVVALGGLGVQQLHGERPSRNGEDGAIAEEGRVLLGLECRGSHDEFEVGSPSQRFLHEPEEDVGVDGTFVGLVEHDQRVTRTVGIHKAFTQQHAIRHVLDHRLVAGAILKPNAVANLLSQPTPKLLAHTLGDRHGGDTTRLRDPDLAPGGVATLCEILWHLRRLSRPGLANDDENLVVGNRLQELVPQHKDGQRLPLLFDGEFVAVGVAKHGSATQRLLLPFFRPLR